MTALALVGAMALDAAFGEPAWLWSRIKHPAVMIGNVISWLEARLYDRFEDRRQGGIALVAALVIGAAVLGGLIGAFGFAFEVIVAAILLAQKSLVQHVAAVGDALRLSVADGRVMVARIVSRDTKEMTQAQVARSAIESGAENLSDGVIAPAFWFLVAGLPGLLIYKAVNTADSMIGYRNERYEDFGWAAARLDDLLNWIPARLTALILVGLSRQWAAWPDITMDAKRHRSVNAGWPEAAMARAIDVSLSGPRSYDGRMQDLAWVNEHGARDIGADDVDRAVAMLWKSWQVTIAGVAILALLALT